MRPEPKIFEFYSPLRLVYSFVYFRLIALEVSKDLAWARGDCMGRCTGNQRNGRTKTRAEAAASLCHPRRLSSTLVIEDPVSEGIQRRYSGYSYPRPLIQGSVKRSRDEPVEIGEKTMLARFVKRQRERERERERGLRLPARVWSHDRASGAGAIRPAIAA